MGNENGAGNRQKVLHAGGLAIVCTPKMERIAREAYHELQIHIQESQSIGFHVVNFKGFSRGEVLPQIAENARLKSVYLFFDFDGDACHEAFLLQLTVSALQSAGAESITLVGPYLPFLRQDRKDKPRVPISAKDFITGYERYEKFQRTITIDMHVDQIQGIFDKRSDQLPRHVILVPYIKDRFGHHLDKVVIVGPDDGSVRRTSALAKRVGCRRAFFVKERDEENGDSEILEHHGADVEGMTCLLVDDIIDSGRTSVEAADRLVELGAREVIIIGTHAVFGEKDGQTAYERFEAGGYEVVVTDSLQTEAREWLTVLPVGRYLGHAILENNVEGGSVSKIIENGIPPLREEEPKH